MVRFESSQPSSQANTTIPQVFPLSLINSSNQVLTPGRLVSDEMDDWNSDSFLGSESKTDTTKDFPSNRRC